MHTPGLHLAMPSTVTDAYHLLMHALTLNDPVVFLEHKGLYTMKGELKPEKALPWGKAEVRRKGGDCTLVSYSRMVHFCLDAADSLSKEGIEAEVIDLRTLHPLDMDTVSESVSRTGRAMVVTEDCLTAGVSAEISARIMEEAFDFLDAPISGGQSGAEGGILTVMVGGDEEVFKKAEPIIDCYSKKVKLIGSCGSGQLTKMMNQMCIAGAVQGLSEAINFGINAGLDMDKVMETISKGAAQSWQMENRYRTMTDDKFDYGFAIDWMRKDLKIAIEEAKRNGSPVPITEIIDGYYAEVQEMGGNRWDSSALIARLKKKK